MKQIATIRNVARISVYINIGKKTLAQVRAETGADYVLNGGLFTSSWRACCHLRADGFTWAEDEWNYRGYGWDDKDIRVMPSGEKESVRNYICCCELVRDGKPCNLIYNADMGGKRGRSAIGLMPDGTLVLYCTKDGTAEARTPEALRDELVEYGVQSAIMLDGGGSSQCDFAGTKIVSSRVVQNLICVWETKEDTPEVNEKPFVYLDPGHGGVENYNCSPDRSYYEHEAMLDMGFRIRKHLERCDINVSMTRETDKTVTLAERAAMANVAGAQLYVSLHSNATGSGSWGDPAGLTVWTYAEGGERERAAKLLLARMREAGVETFGYALYHSKFAVLAQTNMPAYLIEYAFHTNQGDVKLLLSDAHRDKLAEATAKAICDYFGRTWVTPIDEAEAPAAPDDKTIYRVQVGAFTNRENAERLEAQLKAQGYDTIMKED